MRILADTNIILRNVVQSDPQHGEVHDALARLIAQGHQICIGMQNIVEFWAVATRPVSANGLGLSPVATKAEIDVIGQAYTVLPDSPGMLETWLDLCVRYAVNGRSAHDTRLVALMLESGITHILTLNTGDFSRYSEISTLAPADV